MVEYILKYGKLLSFLAGSHLSELSELSGMNWIEIFLFYFRRYTAKTGFSDEYENMLF